MSCLPASGRQPILFLFLLSLPISAACSAEERNGFPLHSVELTQTLAEALAAKGPDYEPRTEHLAADGSALFTNRLILEASPYLVQHAHNPVDWYPWGEEAFERARREDKPVFLSIGYSTCHWCHVMERESFDNEPIAELMNELFVCIKVDREQRPDLDEIYMTALQLTGQRGGWPMSSFLTPDRDPFYGGTYFPPTQFAELLRRVDTVWREQREEIVGRAKQVSEAVRQQTSARGEAVAVGEAAIAQAVTDILARNDPKLGGPRGAPKFPHEPELLFLVDQARRSPNAAILQALEVSLDNMARGGIYDQVGGGFHRYSTDEHWLVPHFEKMLYNQAHLSRAYLGAWGLTGDRFYERTARQILDYVLREMSSPEGVFYSATDADSEGEEGLFFLWTEKELHASLEEEDAELVIDLYGVTQTGNFEGSNILSLARRIEDYAADNDLGLDRLLTRVDSIRERLWQAREDRIHPLRDDKTLLAWNGMMITAYSAAAMALGDSRYLDAARKAAEFLWSTNRRREGRFWRIYLDGKTSIPAMQEDYAYFSEGLLGLFDATGDRVWLDRAKELVTGMVEQFWDDEGGGFFLSGDEIDRFLIARPKTPHDGAIPSGNSVALGVLAKLYARTGEIGYRDRGNELLRAFSSGIVRSPAGHAYMLRSASQLLQGETGSLRYAASGHVRVRASATALSESALDLVVDLEIDAGWHINSSQPLQEELLPLELTAVEKLGWRLADLSFPEASETTLGFQDEALSVYEGDVRVQGRLLKEEASSPWSASLELQVQACNNELCLRPETLRLQVSVSDGS